MTQSPISHENRFWKQVALSLSLAGAVFLGACSSTPPQSRNASLNVKVAGDKEAVAPAGAYTTPDGYPDFARPLTAANVQMSNTDASDLEKKLTALSQMRSAGKISQAEYDRRVREMRKLAADQGK
ncbi:hypothetical protein ACQ3G6_06250 [Allorhizobium undicola]|uniref:hypothetical protein n=1 Tax=Allorhizobium undicola TaxID=78527 RepID=UPI003D3515A0